MNLYKKFQSIFGPGSILVGEITAVSTDGCTVTLLGAGSMKVKGTGTIGEMVYIQRNTIIGPAPSLTGIDIEI